MSTACYIRRSTFLFFIYFAVQLSILTPQNQSDELRKNVKIVRDIITNLEIYEIDKKRLYGAIPKNGAIEFKIQSSPIQRPTALIIGVATDGTIQEMDIQVFTTNSLNEKIKMIRKDTIQNPRDWVFEVMDNSQFYLVDVIVKKTKKETALVELIHGFYYGHQSNQAFTKQIERTGNPSHEAPKQDGDSLFPIDIHNRFEIFRKALWD